MSKSLGRLFVTLILGIEWSVRGQTPWDFDISLICYDNANFTGEWKRFTEYTPDLGPLEFDNRIEACIFTGLWLLYSEPFYNINTNYSGSVWWDWGIANFKQLDSDFFNKASSLKYAGPSTGYKSSSISLYQAENFAGGQAYLEDDTPELLVDQLHAQSLIMTGHDNWSLYESTHYQGKSLCIKAGEDPVVLMPKSKDLSFLAGRVASARKGC